MAWDEGLQGKALKIASTPKSPLCVVAGPGTGKTFALMRRLTRLLEVDKVDPSKILVCTFTRTAAQDIAESVAGLGVGGAEKIVTQTVHGFCFSMLMQQDVLAATERVPRPLLSFEKSFLLRDLQAYGLGGIRECNSRLNAFSAAWARLQHEDPGWPHEEEDKVFQRGLMSWLKFHRAMVIGELIPLGIKYLRDNPQSPYRSMFDHVLVDEYQDLNKAEQSLVDLLACKNLVIVGDEDQSIYSFKYAHPEGIVEFPESHTDTERADLDECRRCPRKVIEIANELISHNSTRSSRILKPMKTSDEGEVFTVQWKSIENEADGLASFIRGRIENQEVDPGKILVLTPRRELGYLLRDKLLEMDIQSVSFFNEQLLDGKPNDLEGSKAQQAVALLTLLANPDDRVALRCWCGFGNNALGAPAWKRVRKYCTESGDEPWNLLEKLRNKELTLPYTRYLVQRFDDLQTRLDELRGLPGDELVESLFPVEEAWASPFVQIASNLEEDDKSTAQKLAESIRRSINQPDLPTDVDFVRVMSLHKSKGLTADLVVVSGCLQGLMPGLETEGTEEQKKRALEEMRRLFYVAITRTRRTLLLSYARELPIADAHKMRVKFNKKKGGSAITIASQFINELGPQCPVAIKGEDFLANEKRRYEPH